MLSIDPDTATEAYLRRVRAQIGACAGDEERATVHEQLSGTCTNEIAAFDEVAAVRVGEGASERLDHDHTVPISHSPLLVYAAGR